MKYDILFIMTVKDKIQLSKNISIVAGIFCSVVAILLLLNYWQYTKVDPVESQVLEALVERLKNDPGNEVLMNEIRSFDLLARKAYFTSQWQIKTGSWLLFFGAVILTVALTFYYTLQSKIEEPDKEHENEIASRVLAQKWIIAVGLLVFGLAFIASFSSVNYLERYRIEAANIAEPVDITDDGIEVIDVGANTNVEVPEEIVTSTIDEKEVETEPENIPVAEEQPKAEPENVAINEISPTFTLDLIKLNHNSFRGPLGQGVAYHKNIPVEWNGAKGDKVLWKAAVPKQGYNSPVIWDDKIFLSGADNQNREIYCFSRSEGKLLWT
ncbi:MAG TPA: hypothetical protein VFD91_16905, partial [Mariniphaga sp.]|nr:hypothetical protein [Mariniphaga sp.]